MRTFLINLDRSTDRLAHARDEFERAGVAFERIAAVDGSALKQEALRDFARTHSGIYPVKWQPGEIGCFLSHFGIWEQVACGEDAFAAVFEDDVHLAADLKNLLGTSEWIPADADIVRLEANRKMLLRDGQRINVAPGRRIFRAASATWGTGGYVIARDAARRLTETSPDLHCRVDVFLFNPGRSPTAANLRTYQVAPAVCVQNQLLSRSTTMLESTIGIEGRKPKGPDLWSAIKGLLPWKKRPIRFRA